MDERYPAASPEPTDPGEPFRAEIGRVEEDALRRLSVLDLPGARSAMERVLTEATDHGHDAQQASYLLYEVLSRVQRIVADHHGLPRQGIPERLRTVRRLAAATSREELRWIFWSIYEPAAGALGGPGPGHPTIERVKSFVRQNYTQKISLARIAEAIGVSRNYLSHLFRRHCGITLTEFIHRTRMKEAEGLLLGGRQRVSEIAALVGYRNYRDFHRNFVRYEKTSPKKFRQLRAMSRSRVTPSR